MAVIMMSFGERGPGFLLAVPALVGVVFAVMLLSWAGSWITCRAEAKGRLALAYGCVVALALANLLVGSLLLRL